MFSIQDVALLISFLFLFLVLAYGRTRWFGKKFHRSVVVAQVLEFLSFTSAIMLFVWQTASWWRLCLLGTAVVVWLLAIRWSSLLEQAQRKISDEVPGKQSA